MRGLLGLFLFNVALYRITPACAGTTTVDIVLNGDSLGSPPRVRGLLQCAAVHASPVGITPACAGTTKRRQINKRKSQDHPRVCGDYSIR